MIKDDCYQLHQDLIAAIEEKSWTTFFATYWDVIDELLEAARCQNKVNVIFGKSIHLEERKPLPVPILIPPTPSMPSGFRKIQKMLNIFVPKTPKSSTSCVTTSSCSSEKIIYPTPPRLMTPFTSTLPIVFVLGTSEMTPEEIGKPEDSQAAQRARYLKILTRKLYTMRRKARKQIRSEYLSSCAARKIEVEIFDCEQQLEEFKNNIAALCDFSEDEKSTFKMRQEIEELKKKTPWDSEAMTSFIANSISESESDSESESKLHFELQLALQSVRHQKALKLAKEKRAWHKIEFEKQYKTLRNHILRIRKIEKNPLFSK